ncbi:MAG: hypothetical protein SGCHY_004527 [Lobulomycetales sp.]
MIETEVNILRTARHDNIIQLYEMHEIEGKIYLLMELVTGGELFDEIVRIGKYGEAEAAKLVHKILVAVRYLHQLGIAHRDLKPENLLLSDKTKDAKIMISDFGLSKIFNDDEVMKTACGTPGYVAPEVLIRRGYGREVDLWSLGVITYILLSGYPPFYDQNNVELFKQIMAGKYEFDRPWWDNISEKAKNFIRHLLVLDPRSRYTADQALAHPFIVDHCGRTPLAVNTTITTARNPLGTPISSNAASPYASIESVASKNEGGSSVSSSWNNIAGSQNERISLVLRPGPKKAKFLSYNIFLRPPGIKNNMSDHKNARHAMFGEQFLKNFDIVALQEMFSYGSSRLSRMVHYGRKHGFEFYVSSPTKSVFNAQADGGLMILSKYPIVRTEKITFKRGVHSDRFSAKGAIYAKIALSSNFFVHVFTTHLQSSPNKNSNISDPTVSARLRQVAILKEFIDDCTKNKAKDEPIVLLGDINANARDNSSTRGSSSSEYQMIYQILNGNISKSAVPCADAGSSPPETPRASVSGQEPRYNIRDLAYEKYGEHPITYADVYPGTKIPRETVLTLNEDLGEKCCLDYILLMNSAGTPEPGSAPLNYTIENTQVEKFIVSDAPFTQISDHYGISTEIVLKQ